MKSRSIQRLAALINARKRILLVGPPGTAKTARFLQVAQLLGWKFFYGIGNRTADLMDRLDAAGAVVPDVAAGVSRVLPLEALKEILECRVPAIWFIDEIGRAPLDVQGAINAIIDQLRRENSPVVVVAATNRPQDRAGVASLSEQLRSRFDVTFSISTSEADDRDQNVVQLAPWADEVAGWTDYAADAGFDPLVVAWHRSTSGSSLYNWKPNANAAVRYADYRSWQTVSELCAAGLRDVDTIAAAIGREIAVKFSAFAALAAELPLPSAVLADPDNAPVPASPAACYFISSALPQSLTKPAQVGAFLRYIQRLPRIYTALAARDLHRRFTPQQGDAPAVAAQKNKFLTGSTDWNEFYIENNALFA